MSLKSLTTRQSAGVFESLKSSMIYRSVVVLLKSTIIRQSVVALLDIRLSMVVSLQSTIIRYSVVVSLKSPNHSSISGRVAEVDNYSSFSG